MKKKQVSIEPWFGAKIPASGEDGREDCGMSAAKVFDSPIPGLRRIGNKIPLWLFGFLY